MRARTKTAMPLPRISAVRLAGAVRNRADPHVSVVDVPAFLAGVSRSAAGERGHAPWCRHPEALHLGCCGVAGGKVASTWGPGPLPPTYSRFDPLSCRSTRRDDDRR